MEVLASTGEGTQAQSAVTFRANEHMFGLLAGRVVTASAKGEIRMFSEVEKNAKTLLPGLGGTLVPSLFDR